MRTIGSAMLVVACASGSLVFAEGGSAAKKAMVLSAPAEIKWAPVAEMPGMQVASLVGDPKTGPNTGLIKFPAGANVPLHHHSAEHKGVVVSGTIVIGPEGGPTKELPAGSFLLVPGGVKHTTACKAGSDCVIFAVLDGADDAILAAPPADAKAAPPAAKK
jgi:quercetin dioxygenase-like cupin family protein